jgi:superfamily II DNA or RNA helicase
LIGSMPVSFETGSLLEVRGERWLLTHVAPHGTATVLTLEGRDRENARQRLRVIDPFDRAKPITSARPKRRPRCAVLRAALGAIVDARPPTGLWTAADASIDLLAYQLEPALAVLSGATRLLLADAVGLGKTIQAGLILSELRERGWIEHALIVCPAGLRDTWSIELASRFGIRAAILDQTAIAERIASLPPGVNPWAGHAVAIASIDFIKRDEVLAALASEPIDLLIADEAHHLTPGTDRGAALSHLASRATWCVLVSATPHSGDQAAFDYLSNIGAHGDAITIFRRRRADVGLATARRSHVLAVTPTSQEAALFTALDRYTQAIWRERGRSDHAVRLIAVTLSRRAASSARAIERTLSRRLDLLGTVADEPVQPLLPWDDEEDADRTEADALLAIPGLDNAIEERSALEQLIALARRCVTESKLRRLTRLLQRLQEPAVIFTEYRDSLEAVAAALQLSHRVGAIHGGVPMQTRRASVDLFNAGGLDVLVATDAAGEGLNLHHRCRLVIDLELPWNPLRLEQRIGRVDRLGQRRTVHAIRMIHPGTIEQHVLEHVRLRERRAESALERQHLTEMAIATAIFEAEPVPVAAPLSIAGIRVASAGEEQPRLERQRRAHHAGAHRASFCSWTPPRNGCPNTMFVVTRTTLSNDAGVIACDVIDGRALMFNAVGDRREARHLLERERLRLAPSGREEEVTAALETGRAKIRERIGSIRANSAAHSEEQSSLFDRRAESASVARRESIHKLDRALSRTLDAIAPPTAQRTRIEVIAAWPERRR